jgi:chromosome segregation protein
MRGFKSFADLTVLDFEPGVTAVVGPNGSGKSNVVDAVTWVLGAQSARALRSSKMDDVIFMGTANRAALGRAEVSLTLDNSSGRLPIDGAEVTISRTLFRNGESDYAINGTTCRLLDVQDLLNDSGVGRQQHMIIGQGQLDSILNSNPETRRAVIEEAAGVLKHRRRKERSERRLAQTQENLERLGDLVREVRRQMRPLERQAVSARHFAEVESELRHARHALFAERLASFNARRLELDAQLAGIAEREREVRQRLATLDAQAQAAAAEMASRREEVLASTLGVLAGLVERARGSASVIDERRRALRAALAAAADENVIATLEADGAKLATDLAALEVGEGDIATQRLALEEARRDLVALEADFTATYGADSDEADEATFAALEERRATLTRSVANLRDAQDKAGVRLASAQARATEIAATREALLETLADAERAATDAEAELTDASHDVDLTEAARSRADAALSEASELAARTQARADALARALDELSGAGGRALVADLAGVLGPFLDLIDVESGWERAVESAAGASLGAVVVDGRTSARAALETLRREGGAGLILAAGAAPVVHSSAPAGCTALRSLVSARRDAPEGVNHVLDTLFARAFVAADFDAGIETAVSHPDLVIVTRDGDRFAASGWRVASGRALVTRSTVDDAERAALDAAALVAPCREARADALAALDVARARLSSATAALSRAQSALSGANVDSERLEREADQIAATLATLEYEYEVASTQRAALEDELAEADAQREALSLRRESALARRAEREEVASALAQRRAQFEVSALEVSRREARASERRGLFEQRRHEIEARLAGHARERDEAATRREALEFDLAALGRLGELVERALEDVRMSQEAMDSSYREQLEATRASAERLESVRAERQATEASLSEFAEAERRGEIERAELVVMIANLHEAVRHDLGVEVGDLGPAPEIELAEGTTLEARVGELEARITSLGPINPLALEELVALEERYQELDAQVSDVRHARRELQEAVRELDEQIMTSFSSAVADVNEHFSNLIGMLFPGGQGRLLLSQPDDPLNTGVEIEVRPMGRNMRRLSLLSGGERSMAALAFLFAVFRSRPSPFYMMDEVEAALDDVNLQRFLSLVDEFRDEAQLLIVTHQKRTMEAADALYGVTMVPGASSKVVSQRVKREVSA